MVEYLQEKYNSSSIELNYIERKYSTTYGWEYHVFFKKDGVHYKEIMSQHMFMTMM